MKQGIYKTGIQLQRTQESLKKYRQETWQLRTQVKELEIQLTEAREEIRQYKLHVYHECR